MYQQKHTKVEICKTLNKTGPVIQLAMWTSLFLLGLSKQLSLAVHYGHTGMFCKSVSSLNSIKIFWI